MYLQSSEDLLEVLFNDLFLLGDSQARAREVALLKDPYTLHLMEDWVMRCVYLVSAIHIPSTQEGLLLLLQELNLMSRRMRPQQLRQQ